MGIKQRRMLGYVCVAALAVFGLSACSPVVFIPDQALESAIRHEIGKPLSPFLHRADLEKVTFLNAASLNISDLEGLQYCTNLRKLNLNDNLVRHIDQLGSLTKLTYLHLGNNRVVDIEAVAGLLYLEYLNLSGQDNAIADWSYLQDNVINGGIGAGAVVLVSGLNTLDAEGNPLPGFSDTYDILQDEGVVVEFRD